MALIFVVLATLPWTSETPGVVVSGDATYMAPKYGPNLEVVAANRGLSLDDYAGGVALNRLGDLERVVWISWGDGEVDGPYLVVDCADKDDYGTRVAKGREAEVGARVAKDRGFYGVGPVPVKVWFEHPLKRLEEMWAKTGLIAT